MASLKHKIEVLIEGLDLSSTKFADLIGVKRPIISHILSERNKPSIDIIQKIVERFPELGYAWIGEDEEIDLNTIEEIKMNNDFRAIFSSYRDSSISTEDTDGNEISNSQPEAKKVLNVMVMYSDGTCQIFKPNEFRGMT